jgi:hypothetical protein
MKHETMIRKMHLMAVPMTYPQLGRMAIGDTPKTYYKVPASRPSSFLGRHTIFMRKKGDTFL